MLNVKVTLWVGRCLRLCIRMTGIRVGFRWNVQHLMEGGGEVIQLSCVASSSWMRRFFALMSSSLSCVEKPFALLLLMGR